MKIVLMIAGMLSVSSAIAAPLKCEKIAFIKAIDASELTLHEFEERFVEIWSQVRKIRGKSEWKEEIQFGDGSGLIGVSMIRTEKNGRVSCKVVDVYHGQDDGDRE